MKTGIEFTFFSFEGFVVLLKKWLRELSTFNTTSTLSSMDKLVTSRLFWWKINIFFQFYNKKYVDIPPKKVSGKKPVELNKFNLWSNTSKIIVCNLV